MSTPAQIVLVEERPAVDTTGLRPWVQAWAERVQGDLVNAESAEAALTAVASRPDAPCLVVLAPQVPKPLLAARRFARQVPDARFVLVAPPEGLQGLQRDAVVGAPPGGRWSICTGEEPSLLKALDEALHALLTDRKLRTTLDRAKLNLSTAARVDSLEYRRLVTSDRYLAAVLRNAHDAIISLDMNQAVVSWNGAASRLFAVDESAARAVDFCGLFQNPQACRQDIQRALADELAQTEWVLGAWQGDQAREQHVEAALQTMRDDAGRTTGVVVILRDVTQRYIAEQALRQANRQKDEFLAMLSHELRNPLAPIRNAAEVLRRIAFADQRAQAATGVISRQVEHLGALVEDLLDVARVTRGAIVLERSAVSLSAVISEAVEQARALIEARGHQLTIIDSGFFLQVDGERHRLTQLFSNVLINAAKYTLEQGQISIGLRQEGDEAVVRITDNGVGIDPHLLPFIFDLFSQGKQTVDRTQGGLGIGLALVKNLVELHGGTVSVQSAGVGQGTTVEVRLPRLTPSASRVPVSEAVQIRAPHARLRLLVVDDNVDAAESLGMLLTAEGHAVDVEFDPRIALERAPALAPDVCILDIGMPHIDGYELARRLRTLSPGDKPMLIALTGYGQPSDKELAKRAGFHHHLTKPLDMAKLRHLLDEATPNTKH